MKRRFITAVLVCAMTLGFSYAALAAWKPTPIISVIVPAGTSGDTDIIARIFAKYAKKYSDADFRVINIAGSAGSVAFEDVLTSAPDGHTFLITHCNVNTAYLSGVTKFDYKAFKLGPTFVKSPAQQLYVISDKYKGLEDFIATARANPGKLIACTEIGAYSYYSLRAFEKAAGIKLNIVDIGGTSDKLYAMLFSGVVDLMPSVYSVTREYVDSGRFKVLGVPTALRYDILREFPTFKEQGIDFVFPDLDYSFYFPAGTSDEIIAWYEDLVQKILNDPEAKEEIKKAESIPYYLSGEDSAKNEELVCNILKSIADTIVK